MMATSSDARFVDRRLPAVLLLGSLAIYWPAMDGGFLWDDADNITESRPLRDPDGLRRIWLEPGATQQYFPLLHTLWRLEYQAFGEVPRGYHLVNVLLHVAAGVLLARVLRRLAVPGAALAAAAFTFHPVAVESVAWITEGKNTLSLVFYLGSLLAYLRFERIGDEAGESVAGVAPRRYGWYLGSVALFAAGVLSKTNAVTLPGVILVLLAWKHGRLTVADFVRMLPMVAIGAAVAAVVIHIERDILGAGREEFAWPWSERILVAGRACWFYLGKIFWPSPLSFIYPRWQVDPSDWRQWLYPVTAALVPIGLWRLRKRIGPGPLVAVLCYGGTLLPQLGLMPLYGQLFSYVADHWVYLSLAPPIALAAAAITTLAARMPPLSLSAPLRATAAGALLVGLCWLTLRQSAIYRDPAVVWSDTISKNPHCWLAHHNLAVLHLQNEQADLAVAGLERAVVIRPEFKEAWNNFGVVAEKQSRHADAERYFLRALKIDPKFADAHANLARLLGDRGELDAAETHLRTALARKPDLKGARAALGLILVRQGRIEEGRAVLLEAAARNPDDVQALVNLGMLQAQSKDFVAARASFEQVLRLNPESVEGHANLGAVAMAEGDFEAARRSLQKAVQLDPRNETALFNLGNVLVRLRRLDDAVDAYRRALDVRPDHVATLLNLAAVHAGRGRRDQAVDCLNKILRDEPQHAQARALLAKLSAANAAETPISATQLQP